METGASKMFAMRRLILWCLKLAALLVFLLFAAIYSLDQYDCQPSAEDEVRLKQLSESYPRYQIQFDRYSLVVKSHDPLSDESRLEVFDIYNKFFVDDNGELKRKTPFLTLDLYDSKCSFQYKIVYALHPADS
jgi:hypothetical protein